MSLHHHRCILVVRDLRRYPAAFWTESKLHRCLPLVI